MDGHERLLTDLGAVMKLAEAKEFHDFENVNFATPKIQLVKMLESIVQNTKEGKYDN